MKTLPTNVIPYRIAGFAVNGLNQELLRSVHEVANERSWAGWTIESVFVDAVSAFIEKCQAEAELETKIIPFPK